MSSSNPFAGIVVIKEKNNGTEHFIHHLQLCGKHWPDTGFPATGNNHHPHPQHRRYFGSGIPDDGNRRIRLYVAGVASPAQHNMVDADNKCSHRHMQLHYLYNKDVQRPQKTTNGDLTPGFENEQPDNSDGAHWAPSLLCIIMSI